MKNITASHTRFKILPEQTQLQHLKNLSNELGGPGIYIKRDDINVLGAGGNKLRKLEFYIAEAINNSCDTIITMGAWQSNHVMLTALAAAKAGLQCESVLAKKVPIDTDSYNNNGNRLLEETLGLTIHETTADKLLESAVELKNKLSKQNRKAYIVPFGGSCPIGCLGYVRCAEEIISQIKCDNSQIDTIVVANGSSGTHAGLLAGLKILNSDIKVYGYCVVQDSASTLSATHDLANKTLALLGHDFTIDKSDVLVCDKCLGDGYGIQTNDTKASIKLMAQKEGIFLDPVYTGKAFTGLVNDIIDKKFNKNENILFVHTGGLPGLFAYQGII